jgi:hypothetical protein
MTPYQPNQEEDRDRDSSQRANHNDRQENPVLPSFKPRGFFFPDQYPIISSVRLPEDVKYVPNDWHSTHRRLEEYVGNHSCERNRRYATPPGREHDYARRHACHGVPDSGYPTDESVEAEPNLRAGDSPHVVQQ